MAKRFEVKFEYKNSAANTVKTTWVTASNATDARNQVKARNSSHRVSIISCVEK